MMALLAGHIKVNDFVLVSIVDIESSFDMELTAFLVLNYTSKSLGNGV